MFNLKFFQKQINLFIVVKLFKKMNVILLTVINLFKVYFMDYLKDSLVQKSFKIFYNVLIYPLH